LRQTLFFETARSHLEPNQDNRVGVPISVIDFWARNCLAVPCELKHFYGGKPNYWVKVQAFFYVWHHVTVSLFEHNKLGLLFVLVE
jgi:hypothetical protein